VAEFKRFHLSELGASDGVKFLHIWGKTFKTLFMSPSLQDYGGWLGTQYYIALCNTKPV
jgi:hypothetical protein